MKPNVVLPGAGRSVAYFPSVARSLDSIPAGLMLCQLIYWADKSHDTDGWVWKVEKDWAEELGITPAQVKGARNLLVGLGLVDYERRGYPARAHYRLDFPALDKWWSQSVEKRPTGRPAKIAGQDGRKSPVIPLSALDDFKALDDDEYVAEFRRRLGVEL